jgi:uncharacterized membrane protein YfbV (UPF0208 family)
MSPAVIVALATLVAFVVLCGITLWKFDADDAIKVLGVFTGVFGLIIGAMGTYFFTRTEVTAARNEAAAVHTLAFQYKTQLANAARVVDAINSKPPTSTLAELKNDQSYQAAVGQLNAMKANHEFDSQYPMAK